MRIVQEKNDHFPLRQKQEQLVDGFLVVSLETLQVILRDERQLLRTADQLPEEMNDTMFPAGFSAARFVEAVETGEVWKGLE